MVAISGKYQHYKNENFDSYFSAAGVPYLVRKLISATSPLMEVTVQGDSYTIKNTTSLKTMEATFKLNEEYIENPGVEYKSVTKKIADDELLTESVIESKGEKCSAHYKFTDEECIITLVHEKASKPTKRYFKRIN